METISVWLFGATDGEVASSVERMQGLLLNVGIALAYIVLGWILARILRAFVAHLIGLANHSIDKWMNEQSARHFHISSQSSTLISNIAFWTIILMFLVAAARQLGLNVFSGWLDEVISYLPTFFAGVLIITVGFILSRIARDLTVSGIGAFGGLHSEVLGQTIQGAVLFIAIVIGVDQIGIDVSFLITIISVIVAVVLGSFSLAFALGSRTFIANLIGAQHMRRYYKIGQKVRIGDHEGAVAEITPTTVFLSSLGGRISYPASVFHEQAIELIVPKES